MVKFPEADARMFFRKFVCKRCKSTLRTSNTKIIEGKVHCRKCLSHAFRAKRKK